MCKTAMIDGKKPNIFVIEGFYEMIQKWNWESIARSKLQDISKID
jgi:hypothetical protein